MTTRDQLIADWHKHLGAASSTPDEPASRAAWLSRVRFRLYRFLLSLYGDGRWNAPPADDVQPLAQGEVVIDAQALPLAGKPAKAQGMIRAVLKSVVNAQPQTPQPGPLVTALDDPWIVVASTSEGIDPHRCARVLASQGIVPRVISRLDDTTVEVKRHQRLVASKLIADRRGRLQLPVREFSGVARIRRRSSLSADECLALGMVTGPLGGMLAIAALYAVWPPTVPFPNSALLAALVLSAGIACMVIAGNVVCAIRHAAARQKSKTPPGCGPRRTRAACPARERSR